MSEEREQALDELALVYMRAAFRAWLEEREQVVSTDNLKGRSTETFDHDAEAATSR